MADLGTSGGLQGIYQGDSAQNNPAYIKPKPNTFGDDIIAEIDKQEKRKKDEQDAFDKQISPFISVDGTKYLPHRVPLIQEQSQRLLQQAMKAKGKGGNVMFNADVNREMTKLQELQSKYGKEAAYAKEIATKLNGDAKYEYTDDFRKDIGKAIEGTIDPEKYVSSEMADKAQTFYKYGTPKAQADLFEFMTPQAEREVILKVMQPDGTYKETVTKGSQIYNTPEGQDAQYQKFLQFTRDGQDPHAKYFLKQAENAINQNDNLAFQQSLLSMTPLEAAEFKAQEAAKIMLERAITTNKLKTVDKTTKVGTGFQFNNNFQSTAGGGAKGRVYNVEPAPIQTMYPAGKDGKPQTDKAPLVKNPKYFSIQSVAQGENAPKVVLGRYKGAVVEGVVRDEDSGKVKFAYIAIPEKKTQGFVLKGDEARSAFVPIDDADINNIRTNIGADQYDASIGKWEKPKETKAGVPKNEKVEYKQLKEYGGHTYGRNSATDEWKKIK
jgi:hypothetical protein